MPIGQALVGGALFLTGATLPFLLNFRGFSFHREGTHSLLARILKVCATCLYFISAITSFNVIDLGISIIFSPGIGGALATAQRLFAWHASTFMIGIGCAIAAECLNWAGNALSDRAIQAVV